MTDDKDKPPPRRRLKVVDPEVSHQLAQMRDRGELKPVVGKRCRICREDKLRELVNDLLAHGHSHPSILRTLEPINAQRPANRQITRDCVYQHDRRHFDLQAPAASVWRRHLEARQTQAGIVDQGVAELVDTAGYLDVMRMKGYQTLVAEDTVVSVDQGAYAAIKLHELVKADSGTEQMARIMATQNRIVAAFRTVVPERYHQAILEVLDGRGPDVIEGTIASDDVAQDGPEDRLTDYEDEDDDD